MTTDLARYTVSDDPALLDLDVVHRYLATESYWAQHIPRDLVERSVRHSLCFGVYHHNDDSVDAGERGTQVGFARVISDRATFAWLADVFVLEAHRGRGLSKRLMRAVLDHPDLTNLRRWMLATWDAHELYRQFGFNGPARPDRLMERHTPDLYRPPADG